MHVTLLCAHSEATGTITTEDSNGAALLLLCMVETKLKDVADHLTDNLGFVCRLSRCSSRPLTGADRARRSDASSTSTSCTTVSPFGALAKLNSSRHAHPLAGMPSKTCSRASTSATPLIRPWSAPVRVRCPPCNASTSSHLGYRHQAGSGLQAVLRVV